MPGREREISRASLRRGRCGIMDPQTPPQGRDIMRARRHHSHAQAAPSGIEQSQQYQRSLHQCGHNQLQITGARAQ